MSNDLDFIEEIRIAQYWRTQLGEYEYVDWNPVDLRRWYVALELRGPDEVRAYLEERTGRHPAGAVTGLVATAPHPPRKIIDIWLRSHEQHSTKRLWYGLAGFMVTAMFVGANLVGCQNLRNLNQLQTNPPAPAQVLPGSQLGPPQSNATAPQPLVPPANQASPPTGSSASSPH